MHSPTFLTAFINPLQVKHNLWLLVWPTEEVTEQISMIIDLCTEKFSKKSLQKNPKG